MQNDDQALSVSFAQACRGGDLQAVSSLLDRQPELACWRAASDRTTGLWAAAEQGHSSVIALLVERGADPNASREPDRVSALYVAAQNGHAGAVSTLCDSGAVVDACKDTGASPLYIASQQGSTEAVRLLLANGADPNRPSRRGLTPLMIAAYQRHDACVAELLQHGADPWVRAQGKSALDWAVAGGYGEEFSQAVALPQNQVHPVMTPHDDEEAQKVNTQWDIFKKKVYRRAQERA